MDMMKFETNLVARPGRLVLPLAAAAATAAALFVVTALVMLAQAVQLGGERPQLRERLAGLVARAAETRPQSALPREELLAIRDRAAFFNKLAGVQGPPLYTVLLQLESLLPGDAYLVNLQHRRATGEVRMVAEARNADQLTAFLQRLEKQPGLGEVLLTRQGERLNQGVRRVQFELRIKAEPR